MNDLAIETHALHKHYGDIRAAALDWLEDEDWLRSEATGGTGPGGGRRTLRYRIHPAIKGKRKGGEA